MNLISKIVFFFLIFFSFCLSSEDINGQGAVLRILNKITTEKFLFTVPLSQKIKLENSNLTIFKCLKIERDGIFDQISLLKFEDNHNYKENDFLGWVFKSSKYLNIPISPTYDIQLEQCLLNDPLFIKIEELY